MPQKFNDTFLGNANVPSVGNTSESAGPAPPSASNKNGATSQADGTENMRAETQTKQAPINSTPSGGKDQRPAGVDSFPERV